MAREAAPKGVVKAPGHQALSKPFIPQAQQRIIPGMTPEMAAKKVKPKKEVSTVTSSTTKAAAQGGKSGSEHVVASVLAPRGAPVAAAAAVLTEEDKEKKSKNLKKKLKQIEEIKSKQSSGVPLNTDQVRR